MSTYIMEPRHSSSASPLERLYHERTAHLKDLSVSSRRNLASSSSSYRNPLALSPVKSRKAERYRSYLVQTRAKDMLRRRGGLEKMDKDIADMDQKEALKILQRYADEEFEYHMKLLDEGFTGDDEKDNETSEASSAHDVHADMFKETNFQVPKPIRNIDIEQQNQFSMASRQHMGQEDEWSSGWDTEDDDDFVSALDVARSQGQVQTDDSRILDDTTGGRGKLSEFEIYQNEIEELERMEQLELELMTNNLSLSDN